MKRIKKYLIGIGLSSVVAFTAVSSGYYAVPVQGAAIGIGIGELLASILLSFGVSYMSYDAISGLTDGTGALDDDWYADAYNQVMEEYEKERKSKLEPSPTPDPDDTDPFIYTPDNTPTFEEIVNSIKEKGALIWDGFDGACRVMQSTLQDLLSSAYDDFRPYVSDDAYASFQTLQSKVPVSFRDNLAEYPYYVLHFNKWQQLEIYMFKYPTALYQSRVSNGFVEGGLPNGDYISTARLGYYDKAWNIGDFSINGGGGGYSIAFENGKYNSDNYYSFTNMPFFTSLSDAINYKERNLEHAVDYELYPAKYNPHTIWGTPELEANGLKDGKLELPLQPQNVNVPSVSQLAELAKQIQQALQQGTAQQTVPGYVSDLQTDLAQGLSPDPGPDPGPTPVPSPEPTPDPKPDPGEEPDVDLPSFEFDLRQLFPFCVPFDLIDFVGVLSAEPETPCFTMGVPVPTKNGLETHEIELDFKKFDGLAAIIRKMELLAFIVGLILLTRNIIRG